MEIKTEQRIDKHKVRDGEGKTVQVRAGNGLMGMRAHFPGSAVEKNAGMAAHQGYAKGRMDCQSLKNKMEGS